MPTAKADLRDGAQAARPAVQARLRQRDVAPRERERLELLKAVALGQDQATIAAWSGRSPRTIRRWLCRFRSEGLAGLPDRARSGRPAQADAAYQEALQSAVTTAPPALGLPFDTWTSARLSAYLAEQTGVQISPGWLRVLLGRLGFARGRPKHTLKHLHDAAAVTACQEELTATAAKSRRRSGAQ